MAPKTAKAAAPKKTAAASTHGTYQGEYISNTTTFLSVKIIVRNPRDQELTIIVQT